MAKPLLSLSTVIDRPEVDIDGKRYELYDRTELSVLDGLRLNKWFEEMGSIEAALEGASDPPTKEQKKLATRHLELSRKYVETVVVDLPPAIVKKLKGENTAKIVFHFLGLPQRARLAEALRAITAQAPQSPKSTGKSSSPG